MKYYIQVLMFIFVFMFPTHRVMAQNMNEVMWKEGIIFGRFMACFEEDQRIDEEFRRNFGEAYMQWYQTNNPYMDVKTAVSLFVNGVYAGVTEQQGAGKAYCGNVLQAISRITNTIGMHVPQGLNATPKTLPEEHSEQALSHTREGNDDPILMWHSKNGWLQGICLYELTFDGQGIFWGGAEQIDSLRLSIDAFDGTNKRIASDNMLIGSFADSNATRFALENWEGDCETKRLVIWKAEATIDGETVDLLQTKRLRIEESPLKESIEITISQ